MFKWHVLLKIFAILFETPLIYRIQTLNDFFYISDRRRRNRKSIRLQRNSLLRGRQLERPLSAPVFLRRQHEWHKSPGRGVRGRVPQASAMRRRRKEPRFLLHQERSSSGVSVALFWCDSWQFAGNGHYVHSFHRQHSTVLWGRLVSFECMNGSWVLIITWVNRAIF